MRFFTLFYFLLAVLIFLFPIEVFYLINLAPKLLQLGQAIPEPTESFFLVYASSAMILLGGLSLLSSLYPKTPGYPLLHLLSVSVTSAGFAFLFYKEQPYFAYGIGFGGNLLIALLLLWAVIRMAFVKPRDLKTIYERETSDEARSSSSEPHFDSPSNEELN